MSHRSIGTALVVAGLFFCVDVNRAQAQYRMSPYSMRFAQQMYAQQYQQQAAMQKAMMEAQQKQNAADAAEEKRLHDKKVSASRARAEKEKAKKEEIIAKRKADNAAKAAALTAPLEPKKVTSPAAKTDTPDSTKN